MGGADWRSIQNHIYSDVGNCTLMDQEEILISIQYTFITAQRKNIAVEYRNIV